MKNRLFYIYYILLVLLLLTWHDSVNLPPMPLRLAYTCAFVLPLMFMRLEVFPFLFLSVVSFSATRYAPSYMMFRPEYVAIVLLLNHLFFRDKEFSVQPPKSYEFLLFVVLLSDLINDGYISQLGYTLFGILLVLSYFVSSQHTYKVWTISFIISTLILSIEFFLYGRDFATQIIAAGIGYERLGWTDPNYFSCAVGMGTLLCFQQFMNRENNLIFRMVMGGIFGISFISIIMMASRGAFLALCIGVLVFFLMSSSKVITKVLVSISIVVFMVVLLNNNVFDLLTTRILDDDGTGSGRSTIWAMKLQLFSGEGNILSWLFGYGNDGGMFLGSNSSAVKIGFHNDFIAFLVEYGILGLLMTVLLFFLPFRNGSNKFYVLSSMAYMFIVCITLEPLTNGRVAYWLFILYILYVSIFQGQIALFEKKSL